MKKVISVILAVVLVTSMLGITAFADILAGDADKSGIITATDARLILQYVAEINTSEDVAHYDINFDKEITATDARIVLRIVADLQEHPEVEYPDVEQPDVEQPDVEQPDVEQPDVEKPDVEKPDTKEEQLAYFVESFNGVKANAKSVTRVGTKVYNYDNYVYLNPMLELADPTMKDQLTAEFSDELVVVNETFEGKDIYEQFPPYNNTCKLTMNDVSAISFAEDGDYYNVEIKVRGKKNPSQYEGVGNVATIVTKEAMESEMSEEDREMMSIDCDYKTATVKAKIDKATGNMVEYSVDYPLIMIMSINGLGKMAEIGMGLYEEWTIAY